MSGQWVLWGAVVAVALYAVFVYNALVSMKHAVAKAWANIDVMLKQRHDELPKLVEVCQQYRQFEHDLLLKVTQARSQVQQASVAQDLLALGRAETALRQGLGQIFAVAEAYPELRANEQFAQLMSRISALEEAIADRRELYNESVNLFNARIEQFPDVLVARRFDFSPRQLLQFSDAEKADVDVKALFKA